MTQTVQAASNHPANRPRTQMISNFLLFQIGWFACVLGAAHQLALAGSLVATGIIVTHIWRAQQPLAELRLILTALLIGAIFESLFTLSHLSRYDTGIFLEGYAPHWMIMIWGLFATTINVSMRWVKTLNMLLLALLGGALAPLSYLAGQRLGAVTFTDTTLSLLWIALGWAILFPALVFIARKNDGYSHNTPHNTNAAVNDQDSLAIDGHRQEKRSDTNV